MARIYKRGDSWYIDVRVRGQRIRKRVGRSKKMAELALKDAEIKIARDKFGFTKNDLAIDKLIERFLESSRVNHAPGTTSRFTCVLGHFSEFLRVKYSRITHLSQVTPELVDQYKVHRKGLWINPNGLPVNSTDEVKEYTRKGPRARTVNYELKVLTNVFNVAIDWGYIEVNPTKKVKRLKVNDLRSTRFLSERECRRLLKACSPELYPVFFTYLNTDMRRSELIYLEWEDIDLRRRKIKIQPKEDRRPKSGNRELPLNKAMVDLLKSAKQANDRDLKSKYVFPHKDGERIRVKLRDRMIQTADKAGIKNLTKLYTLRHTFASQLVMKGVDLPTVKKLMGHSDIETTMIYAHLAPDHLANVVDKLEF